jgi:hypothetical protein
MIKDEELIPKIDEVIRKYSGDGSTLNEAIGILVAGRLTGWKVQRLISSRRSWALATKEFGDLKELLPEKGAFAHKSVGLEIVESVVYKKICTFWDVISGRVSRDFLTLEQRRMLRQ